VTAAGIPIWICSACGHAVFPPRLLCPRCGASEWREQTAERGTVEETTEAVFRTHAELEAHRLASVHTDAGPVVIARLLGEVQAGAAVSLALRDGAVTARGRDLA
jgi:uncharacterized OB-fold protein